MSDCRQYEAPIYSSKRNGQIRGMRSNPQSTMLAMFKADRIERKITVGNNELFGPLRAIQSMSTLEFQWLAPLFDPAGPAVSRRATAESSCSLSRNRD